MASINGLITAVTKGSGKKTKCMDMVCSSGLTEDYTKADILKTRKKVREY